MPVDHNVVRTAVAKVLVLVLPLDRQDRTVSLVTILDVIVAVIIIVEASHLTGGSGPYPAALK